MDPKGSNDTNLQNEQNEQKRTIINRSPKGRYVCYNDVLGRGAYKVVYRGYDTHSGIEVAWNLIRFDVLEENEKELIVDEVQLLKQLSSASKHIIQFHNAWIDTERGDLIVITELALSGTLKEYIRKINNVNLRVIKKWCIQILEGIEFLHEQKIAHRDLKCNNIFINSNTGNIIIGDLGLAKQRNTKFHSVIGTPEYMAPEMYEGLYDEKVDIYAFGLCFLEMITKKVPYCECPGVGSVYKKVSGGQMPSCLDGIKNDEAKNIIIQCINFDPKRRPSATDLLNHPFFQIITTEDNDDILLLGAMPNPEPKKDGDVGCDVVPPSFKKQKTPAELMLSDEETIEPTPTQSRIRVSAANTGTGTVVIEKDHASTTKAEKEPLKSEAEQQTNIDCDVTRTNVECTTESTLAVVDRLNQDNEELAVNTDVNTDLLMSFPTSSLNETETEDDKTVQAGVESKAKAEKNIEKLMDTNLKMFAGFQNSDT